MNKHLQTKKRVKKKGLVQIRAQDGKPGSPPPCAARSEAGGGTWVLAAVLRSAALLLNDHVLRTQGGLGMKVS